MARWLRYVACEGQVQMAAIGYSPLPPNLSQEMANSVARMQGSAPEALHAGNCANPRFSGSLGPGAESPPDPLANVASLSGDAGAAAAADSSAVINGANGAGAGAGAGADAAASSKTGGSGARAVGGGSDDWRDPKPIAYTRPGLPGSNNLPLLALLALIAIPPIVAGGIAINVRKRQQR
jgi:phosphate transport system substrate-binding protein